MSNIVEVASQSEVTRQSVRRFEIVDSCEISSLSKQNKPIELWYPIIPDTPFQRVLDISISAPGRWALCRELEHGNIVLYSGCGGSAVLEREHRTRTGVLGWELQRHPRTFHLAVPFCGNPGAADS